MNERINILYPACESKAHGTFAGVANKGRTIFKAGTLPKLLALACAFGVMGCATPYKPTRVYEVESFKLVIMDSRNLYPRRGYCDMKHRIIYVQWSDVNKDLPRLETLGHEVWHLPELGGVWHK